MEKNKMSGIQFVVPQDKTESLIKVIGIGGGGGNAVKNMYENGVKNVSFAVCNTDSQALSKSPIPVRIQLGEEGLGVGGDPVKGREKAEESIKDIELLFDNETRLVFLTAGLGGGTGTGAAPLIAQIAREKGMLTVGVVTLPFRFEKKARMEKALAGVEQMKQNVDALLVVNNERLLEVYGETAIPIDEAFDKADDILTIATKTISEVITEEGRVNRDFKDVETVMKNGGGAIVSVGYGIGEKRILKAMKDALNSPLLNIRDIENAQKLLYIIYSCKDKPINTSELSEINEFMDTLSTDLEVLWGLYYDDTIGEQVKVAVIATGFDKAHKEQNDVEEKDDSIRKLWELYYPNSNPMKTNKPSMPETDCSYRNEKSEDVSGLGEESATEDGRQRSNSWFSSLVEFVKRSLEEE